MKYLWMYLFLILLVGILVRNASGSTGIILAGSSAGSNLIGALQGPASSQAGTFSFGSGTSSTKFTLG